KYYENGPLPTWIGWYAHQLPHSFHAATALLTLVVELGLVWLLFVPRRGVRVALFVVVTLLQVGVIATAHYAFLNYLVLILVILLLDDRPLSRLRPLRDRPATPAQAMKRLRLARARRVAAAAALAWVFYATVVAFGGRRLPGPLLAPAIA